MTYDVCADYQCPPPYHPLQYLYLIIGILSIIPTVKLLTYYGKLRTREYLIFAGFFVCISIDGFILFLKPWNINLDDTQLPLNLIILEKIEYISFNLTYYLVFVHCYHLLWEHPPRMIRIGWRIWTVIMIGLIIFTLPSETFIIVWALLSEFYRAASGLMGVIAYRKVDPINPTRRIKKIMKIWSLAVGFIMLNGILQILIFLTYALTWNTVLLTVRSASIIIFGLLSMGLACYIAIIYPESILVSHAQLVRASELYEKIISLTSVEKSKPKQMTMDDFTNYLVSIQELIKTNS